MLSTRPISDHVVVEQAKGALMLRYGVTSCESLAAMARWAREAHVTIEDVAQALVDGVCQGRVTPENQDTVRWLEQCLRTDIAEIAAPAGEAASRTGAVAAHAPAPPMRQRAGGAAPTPQWRYTSAVHAARALGGA